MLFLRCFAVFSEMLAPTVAVYTQELTPEEKKAGFVSMFNGKDLTGWSYMGKGVGTFSVKDGAIHYKGGGGWLCYTVKEYPDFELRCEFALIKKGGDGGIFFSRQQGFSRRRLAEPTLRATGQRLRGTGPPLGITLQTR